MCPTCLCFPRSNSHHSGTTRRRGKGTKTQGIVVDGVLEYIITGRTDGSDGHLEATGTRISLSWPTWDAPRRKIGRRCSVYAEWETLRAPRGGAAAQRPKGETVWGTHEWTRLHRTPEETPLAYPVSSLALLCAPYDPTLRALVPDLSLRPLSTRLLNSGSTRGTGLVWLRRESKSSAVHFVLGCIVYTRSLISVVRVNENGGI